ncbi:MAG: hypothetical protein LBT75_04935 [Bacilli bacterium]|jgi:hypothetical protein|nr:hypothetical protein [Bacilli bacterium]
MIIKDNKLLIVMIFSAIEMSIALLMFLIMLAFVFSGSLGHNTVVYSRFALVNEIFMVRMVLLLFGVFFLYALVKFILSLLSYLLNKNGLKIALLILLSIIIVLVTLYCFDEVTIYSLGFLFYNMAMLVLVIISLIRNNNPTLDMNYPHANNENSTNNNIVKE